MDLSKIISDIAAGSAKATPNTGSQVVDLVSGVPADLLNYVADLVKGLGS